MSAASAPSNAYFIPHHDRVHKAISAAIAAACAAQPADPLPFLGRYLLGLPTEATQASPLVLPPEDVESIGSDKWTCVSWAKGVGVHRVVAAALQPQTTEGTDEDAAALAFLRGLKSRSDVAERFSRPAVAEALTDLVWAQVTRLQEAGAATTKELQNKFAGAPLGAYSGLSTFFSGLEGVVGRPDPKVMEGMATEHLRGVDADAEFVTSNYGVSTTTRTEWLFVTDESATPAQLGRECWPVEAEEKLPDRSHCRVRRPLSALEDAATLPNEQLKKHDHAPLARAELIAINLYTGPLFLKYNAVLRGLRSTVPFLINTMITLCCSKEVTAKYKDGSITFEEACSHVNMYTTTLHAINSAIIKLGKLTTANKVYRGISGLALPTEFWEPNEYGVKGGIENAFMSTTVEQAVAMGYAAGDGQRMGIVLEMQQGMVDRGADVSSFSQYPHEREILFGPLTGIEVLGTRIDGSVLVVECTFSVNLTALTLEQVVGQRKKIINDIASLARHDIREHLANRRELQAVSLARFEQLLVDGYSEWDAEIFMDVDMYQDLLRQLPEWYNTEDEITKEDNFVTAVRGIQELKRRATGPALIEWLNETSDDTLRQARPEALAQCLEEPGQFGVSPLRDATVAALVAMGVSTLAATPGLLEAIESRLRHPSSSTRAAAVRVLESLPPDARARYDEAIIAAWDLDLHSGNEKVCRAALEQLRRFCRSQSDVQPMATYGESIAKLLADDSSSVRVEALTAFRDLGMIDPSKLAPFEQRIAARLSDDVRFVRGAAIDVLVKLTPSALATHAPAISRNLTWRGSFAVRAASVQALSRLEPQEVAKYGAAIAGCLEDDGTDDESAGNAEVEASQSRFVVEAAVLALGSLSVKGREAHATAIAQLLQSHKNEFVHIAALRVLGTLSIETLNAHRESIAPLLRPPDASAADPTAFLAQHMTTLWVHGVMCRLEPDRIAEHITAILAVIGPEAESARHGLRLQGLKVLASLSPEILRQHPPLGPAMQALLDVEGSVVKYVAAEILDGLKRGGSSLSGACWARWGERRLTIG